MGLDYRGTGKVSREARFYKRYRYSALLLLRFALFDLAGDLHSTQTAAILGNPAIERFGDPLAIVRCAQPALVARVANEGNLRQNRRHVGSDQNDEWSLLDPTVPQTRVLDRQA